MRLALGVIAAAGFKPDVDFLFGRPGSAPEGLLALMARIQSGEANASLPDDLKITDFRLFLSRKFPTDIARNEICQNALDYGADALLFLDADMVHPADMVERLLVHRKPVITARYHLKKAPFASVAYVKHRTQTGRHRYASIHFGQGVFEIERGGAGALLIQRAVLEGIRDAQLAEWAQVKVMLDGLNDRALDLLDVPEAPTCQWFRYQRSPDLPHDMTTSEDFWFFKRARLAGFSCWCDWDIDVPHLGVQPIDGSWNGPFLRTQMAEYENPELRDFVLGNTIVCGYPDGMQLNEDAHVPAYVVTAGER